VVSTHVSRGKRHAPDRVTHRFKVVGRSIDRASLGVLGAYDPGSDICHHPEHFRPEIIRNVPSSSRAGIGLTRKTARNAVNNASPWASVEGTNIVPNGERWKMPFILSLHESSDAIGIAFDRAYGSVSEKHSGENAASNAREKFQLIHSSSSISSAASKSRARYCGPSKGAAMKSNRLCLDAPGGLQGATALSSATALWLSINQMGVLL